MKLFLILAHIIGGTGFSVNVAGPGDTIRYDFNFKGGEPTVINLTGDGKSEIDCSLFDTTGKELATDVSGGDKCHIVYTPSKTIPLVLLVRNGNKDYDKYTLVVD